MTTTLTRLAAGEQAVVLNVHGGCGLRHRLRGVGIHPGDSIEVIRAGFLGGPLLVRVHGAQVAIGRGQAQRIEVRTADLP